MATEKQIEANRKNAQKSTGPITSHGKAASSQNSLTHGLLASETLLPWEEAATLEDLRESLRKELRPEGKLEELLLDRITSLTWRLRRSGRIESGLFAVGKYGEDKIQAKATAESFTKAEVFAPRLISMEPKIILDEKEHEAAQNKISEIKSLEKSELATLGRVYKNQSETLQKLSRYEVGIERSLFKALHELQRLQDLRVRRSAPVSAEVSAPDTPQHEI
jgi:hypothetical protein